MHFNNHWTHPVSETEGFALFLRWLSRADERLDLAAETLGVSARTAQRWMRQRRVPQHVAVMLDQIHNGPAIAGGLWRGRGAMLRHEWRPYLRTKFKDLR